ncbi:helix-turn-helix domain-containing protein [Siphonobacter sp. SORGH_AS_0500]|uniref:helix-turn-helix domain-containing protein n=1 Tax=Siphonobacter sp. SORGH_AS_0500 TaxID=1864824 RepID=UPI00285B53B0|nr:helix-turn-helix domain-containing protein [Siphonobacter sp. SORGH_AS_0500]MDR6197714.1 AraC family transcriptional activator of pobA [Siphonobacter sp. SORGH_AS_0500]
MNLTTADQSIPTYTLEQDPIIGNKRFNIVRFNGTLTHPSELLMPHRKAYYLLVLCRRGNGRHWVDMRPYATREQTFYFFVPHQIVVKEESTPMWGTAIAFDEEFLALQENATLRQLPLILNPHNVHELMLAETDVVFMEDLLEKISTEHTQTGHWHQRMLSAYLTVLLTYLSRLYAEQFDRTPSSTEKLLLKKYQSHIDEHFQQLHQVSDYAALLHVSAGYLSEVVKAQSGKPAITHIHERLVMEARRLLFHTEHSLKEIGYTLGFNDASYFSRFFKRETNLTPAEYRATTREMYQ